MIRVRNRGYLAQNVSASIAIIRLFSVRNLSMKNPHNPDIDILRLKPLYNGSTDKTSVCIDREFHATAKEYCRGMTPGKVKDVGNCQKRCVAQVTVLEEPVRRKYVRGSNAEVKSVWLRPSPAAGAESPGLSPETFAVGRFILAASAMRVYKVEHFWVTS